MADQDIVAKLILDSKEAGNSVKSFKAELKEATQALVYVKEKFGENSQEALKLAKHIAELKDKIQDAKETADLFDPGARFQAFGNVLRTVAGGFSAITGTMALFGAESEGVQKTMMKLQAAMAITEGVNTIADSAKDFQRLAAIIQQTTVYQKALGMSTALTSNIFKAFGIQVAATSTAFKALRGAIIATGIGALVIGVTLLISKISSWISSTNESEAAQLRLNAALEAQQYLLNSGLKAIDRYTKMQTVMAEITGKSEAEISKIEASSWDDRVKLYEDNYKRLDSIAKDDAGRSFEDQKKANDARLEAHRQYLDALADREYESKKKDAEAAKKKRQEDEAAAKSAADKAKAAREQAAKEREADVKSAGEMLRDLENQNALARIKDAEAAELKKIDQDKRIEEQKIEALKISEEKKRALLLALEESTNNQKNEIIDKYEKERIDKDQQYQQRLQELKDQNYIAGIAKEEERRKAEIELSYQRAVEDAAREIENEEQRRMIVEQYKIDRDAKLKVIEDEKKAAQAELAEELALNEMDEYDRQISVTESQYAKKFELAKGNAELTVQLEEEKAKAIKKIEDARLSAQLDATSKFLGSAASLFGKHTAAYKVMAIAQTTIDTFKGAQAAFTSMSSIPVVGPALGALAAAAAVVSGYKNIRQILNTKVPGGGGGATAPSISVDPVAAPLAPQAAVTSTSLDQNSINEIGNAASGRAYVLESDVTGNQERIARLNRAARIGG